MAGYKMTGELHR